MHASQHYAGQPLHVSNPARDGRDLGIKTGRSRTIAALADFAEDIVILGQFAFGREYVSLPRARGKATLLVREF